MRRACSTYGEKKQQIVDFGEARREKRPLGRPRLSGSKILKLILKKMDWKIWTELHGVWLRIWWHLRTGSTP
jgi:hypothetical protein